MEYKFLIYISYSYSLPIGIPLEEEIIKNGYTVKWFSDLDDGKKALENKINVLTRIEDVINYKPEIVLAATDSVPDFISGIKVQVFHGFNAEKRPIKGRSKFAHFRIRGFFDLYCTQGPTTTNEFITQKKMNPHFEVVETGWSKVDPMFPLVPKNKSKVPTIMIASTFTKHLSLAYDDSVFNEIKRLLSNGKYRFIMVLHPKLPNDIITKWKTLNGVNFKFYNTTDLIPLFKKADIMFSDTTSAIQEFLIQKKPVVTYKHTFKHDYLIHVNIYNEIEQALDKALSIPPQLIKKIEDYILKLHPYFDGKSSMRVINATINFLHKDKSHLKKKPLNLIRKFKMRKRLNYFTFKSYNRPFTIELKNNNE